jgi:inositol-phosphate phosphatase/L-galactose 1-phosphate phosphatase
MSLDLVECLHVAIALAREAGAVQAAAHAPGAESVTIVSKGGIDLVTDVDRRCEDIIMSGLRAAFPTHHFIGEETAAGVELTDAPTWCVDPVDGTTNFIHRFPCFCVSIGLCVGREPVVGVIYDPSRDELYHAVRGGGAFVNDLPIRVDASATSLPQAVVATNFGHSRDPTIVQAAVSAVHRLLAGSVRGVRMTGSCCMAMAHVARGWITCYYESDVGGLWDVAAGTVLVREAGGVVKHPLSGKTVALTAGKQQLSCGHEAVVDLVRRQQYGREAGEEEGDGDRREGSGGCSGGGGSGGAGEEVRYALPQAEGDGETLPPGTDF